MLSMKVDIGPAGKRAAKSGEAVRFAVYYAALTIGAAASIGVAIAIDGSVAWRVIVGAVGLVGTLAVSAVLAHILWGQDWAD
jgi:hypothetical protein